MAVTPGGRILAAEYNSLQSRIQRVLGNGQSTFGYGQVVSSSQVGRNSSVTSAKLVKLRDDLGKAYTHQTGDTVSNVLTLIQPGDIIGALESDGDTTKGFQDYIDLTSTIETNRFNIDASQTETEDAVVTDTRSTSWSRIAVISEVNLSFPSANARRHFFNAGGLLRISGEIDNLGAGTPSYARNLGWKQIVENPGYISFGRSFISLTNPGTLNSSFPQGFSYGNDQLTDTYTEIFRKGASGAVYSNSYWSVAARSPSSSTIRFRITLVDDGPESDSDGLAPGSVYGGINEPVTADIKMRYGGMRSAGAVDVPFPTFSIVNSFQ